MSKVIRKIISTGRAPKPVAPYNQAVQLDNTLYVSGVLGLDKDTMKLVEGDAAAQARQALVSLGHILEAAGTSYQNVVKSTIFLNDINDFAAVNEVYKEFFTENYPARSAFQVGKLPLSALVEIEVVAAVGAVVMEKCNLVFTENFPARSAFQVGKLPLSALVEIEVVAAVGAVALEKCNL